ncbi:MAG: hypothetical protein K5739_00270 [Lachnospiraceae bacterium]|nr:hypothetical protein [Lachnospiraceae bacterium]
MQCEYELARLPRSPRRATSFAVRPRIAALSGHCRVGAGTAPFTIYLPLKDSEALDSEKIFWQRYDKQGNVYTIAEANGKLSCEVDPQGPGYYRMGYKDGIKTYFTGRIYLNTYAAELLSGSMKVKAGTDLLTPDSQSKVIYSVGEGETKEYSENSAKEGTWFPDTTIDGNVSIKDFFTER